MRMKLLEQLLLVLLSLLPDIFLSFLELRAAVFDHFLGGFELFQGAIYHARVDLVVFPRQLLG